MQMYDNQIGIYWNRPITLSTNSKRNVTKNETFSFLVFHKIVQPHWVLKRTV